MNNLYDYVFRFAKGVAPFSIALNIIFALALLVGGLFLLSKRNRESRKKRIGGTVCLSAAGLAFLGAVATTVFSIVKF